jgi:intracellular septation protein
MNEPKSQLADVALNLGPLVLFYAAFRFFDIYVATGVLMAAVLAVLGIGYAREKRLLPTPLITAVLVVVLGGLTLYFKNAMFIKMKLTMFYVLACVVLLGGLAFDRLFIKYIFSGAFELTDAGWRKLTWRFGVFALAIAAANEIVWRNFSTAIWVDFKVWGVTPLFFLFVLAQMPFIMKHQIEDEKDTRN